MIALARSAISSEVTGQPMPVAIIANLMATGVFVTIETQGRVIGCRGTLVPRCVTLRDEIIAAARSAAGHDPRYGPLRSGDLKTFFVTVTLVERLEPITSAQIDDLSPGQGLVLSSGSRTGVVLPWEGKDPKLRLHWAYQKAGVALSTPCRLRRMIARRFRG